MSKELRDYAKKYGIETYEPCDIDEELLSILKGVIKFDGNVTSIGNSASTIISACISRAILWCSFGMFM